MENKKISVIMGIYNCSDTLERAVESVAAQTYPDWDIIMCDDGSTDGTYAVAKTLADKYPDRITLIKNEKNMGLANALNRCLPYAKGDYIARMDADDESFPERFEIQAAFLDSHSDCVVCGTLIETVSELSGKTMISPVETRPDRTTLHRRTPFNHATIMCRPEMYEILRGYSEKKSCVRCEDMELWFRFFKKGLKGQNIQKPLYRVIENRSSVYRVTPKGRINKFVTALKGYKMLGYPLIWYAKPIFDLSKILIPRFVQIWIRKKG